MKSFKEQQEDLVKNLVNNLCMIRDTSHFLPHVVYIEEEDENGESEYNKYKLLDIRKEGGCSVLDCNGIRIDQMYSLNDINIDWLISIWERHIEWLIENRKWRDDAIELLQEHTDASLNDIVNFCDTYWQNVLPYTENLKAFQEYIKNL